MACIVFVEFTVKEQAVDQVNDLMASQDGLPTTRSQKGCLSVEVLTEMDNSNHFVLIEKWESKDDQLAYLKYREEEGPEGALAQLMPLLDGEPKFIYWNIDSVY